MRTATWVKFPQTAEMFTLQGASFVFVRNVDLMWRSTGLQSIRIFSPDLLPINSRLLRIRDKNGGAELWLNDAWQIQHNEPVYDAFGNRQFYMHQARRVTA